MNILSADIGGTNSRFAHFQADREGNLSLLGSIWLNTQRFPSFNHLLEELEGQEFSLRLNHADIAVFAVAGPVEGGQYSSPPFISWDIDLAKKTALNQGFPRSILLNDFVAQAFACRSPVGNEAESILPGVIDYRATLAVIGAGTALGKAALVPDSAGGYQAVPSEGGHTNFPFVSREEYDFSRFLLQKSGVDYIASNAVVSGKGLSAIHHYLTGEEVAPHEATERISQDSETFEWAARFYGRACRNYALETLAHGGVYIAGGVAAKNPFLVKHKTFETEFRNSLTMGSILKKIPVFLIRNEESGLWGAAVFGLQKFRGVTIER